METRGENLLGLRVREQVTGELLDGELVEGHVRVERIDHPVAPRPIAASRVGLKAISIAVARAVEPPHRHAFAEVRRGEQLVDQFIEACLDLIHGRWQSGQVERKSAPQGVIRSQR